LILNDHFRTVSSIFITTECPKPNTILHTLLVCVEQVSLGVAADHTLKNQLKIQQFNDLPSIDVGRKKT
jgi:hypothetical protein